MEIKNDSIFKKLMKDLREGTSYSVDFLLDNDVEKTISKHGIKIRKLFAPIMRTAYRFQSKYKLTKPKREKLSSPLLRKIKNQFQEEQRATGKIFLLNHRQADDIVLGVNAVAKSGYVVFGNAKLALETINGLGLWGYGVIIVDRDNEESRKASYEKMKYVIQNGGNVIVYGEGYWNLDDDGLTNKKEYNKKVPFEDNITIKTDSISEKINLLNEPSDYELELLKDLEEKRKKSYHQTDGHNSENWLMQDINLGPIRLAQETGAAVVPTVLHYDEIGRRKCYPHRGKEMFVEKEDDLFLKKDEVVTIMHTMYYNLMNKYSHYERKNLEGELSSPDYRSEYLKVYNILKNQQLSIPDNHLISSQQFEPAIQELAHEICRKTMKEQWEELKEELIRACDIPSINYQLDLADEKLIGKAKVGNPVFQPSDIIDDTIIKRI